MKKKQKFVQRFSKDGDWIKKSEEQICVGDLIDALSLYPKRTKLVESCICIGADTKTGVKEWNTYLYGLNIEHIDGINLCNEQVKGIRLVFEDDGVSGL